MSRKNILSESGQQIATMYRAGETMTEIARQFGVNRTSIARCLGRLCVEIHGDKTTEFLNLATRSDTDDCVIWPYSRNNKGYGEVRVAGRKKYAHRIVCASVNGPPPSSRHQAAHSCGNGHLGCVNPRHLSWKTPVENCADKVDHGTAPTGDNNGRRKLSSAEVREIRFIGASKTQREIASRFGVKQSMISRILSGKNWRMGPASNDNDAVLRVNA